MSISIRLWPALWLAFAGLAPGDTAGRAAFALENDRADSADFFERARPEGCGRRGGLLQQPTLFTWNTGGVLDEGGDSDEGGPLTTDRPDFTEASTTVGKGRAQFEFGYTHTRDAGGGASRLAHSLPELLARVGALADWLELRLGYSYVDASERDANGRRVFTGGSEDLYLGAKLALTRQRGWLPEMALMPQMTVPTGSPNTTSGESLPGVNWLYGWDVSDNVSVAGSTQFNRAVEDGPDEHYIEYAQSMTIGVALTDRVGSYFEWFCLTPVGADAALPEHYLNGGFTFLVNDDLQFDVRAGFGLNEAADDHFLGVGGAKRF